jgi:hypothetical protein
MFAILACVPDRQRTLRELELNRTLFCEEYEEALDTPSSSALSDEDEEGELFGTIRDNMRWVRRRRWVVRHNPEDYKTGGAYGARPALVLDSRLYPALESWLFGRTWGGVGGRDVSRSRSGGKEGDEDEDVDRNHGGDEGGGSGGGESSGGDSYTLDASSGPTSRGHRAALSPTHARVFCRPNGEPWNGSELSRTFSRAAMRLTGKKTNPHLIRDMVITHVRGEGLATDAELEALSLYMVGCL